MSRSRRAAQLCVPLFVVACVFVVAVHTYEHRHTHTCTVVHTPERTYTHGLTERRPDRIIINVQSLYCTVYVGKHGDDRLTRRVSERVYHLQCWVLIAS